MSDDTANILIVDDDPALLELLEVFISDAGYGVLKAGNGQEALNLITAGGNKVDAIVSDVEMPELGGYELCQRIREMPDFKETPFIFVSVRSSLEEKLKGYEVGGDDYVTKPIEGQEVVIKIQHIIDNRIKHLTLAQQLTDSHKAAMHAMAYSSNLGQVLQFMSAISNINDFEALSGKLFEVATGLGLVVVIQFHTPAGILNFKSGSEVTPLEANVIELARNKGRFFDFDSRTLINYKDFSLLVLNMPTGDNDKYGLMKDILGSLCDSIESKVKLLLSSVVMQRKDDVIKNVTQSLERVGQSYGDIQQANLSAIDDMIGDMEEAMFGFGLSESQEDTVRGIILYAKNKTAEIFEDGKVLYEEFDKIRNILINGMK